MLAQITFTALPKPPNIGGNLTPTPGAPDYSPRQRSICRAPTPCCRPSVRCERTDGEKCAFGSSVRSFVRSVGSQLHADRRKEGRRRKAVCGDIVETASERASGRGRPEQQAGGKYSGRQERKQSVSQSCTSLHPANTAQLNLGVNEIVCSCCLYIHTQ